MEQNNPTLDCLYGISLIIPNSDAISSQRFNNYSHIGEILANLKMRCWSDVIFSGSLTSQYIRKSFNILMELLGIQEKKIIKSLNYMGG